MCDDQETEKLRQRLEKIYCKVEKVVLLLEKVPLNKIQGTKLTCQILNSNIGQTSVTRTGLIGNTVFKV